MEEGREIQLLTTNPEARRMHSKDGFHCCYNVQTAVDDGSHLIAEYEVTNHNTDQGLLHDMAESVKEAFDLETVEVVADKGQLPTAAPIPCSCRRRSCRRLPLFMKTWRRYSNVSTDMESTRS